MVMELCIMPKHDMYVTMYRINDEEVIVLENIVVEK